MSILSCQYRLCHISKAPIRPSGHIRDTRLGVMGVVLETISWVVIVLTFPLSMLFCFKVRQNNVYRYLYNTMSIDIYIHLHLPLMCTGSDRVRASSRVQAGPTKEGRLSRTWPSFRAALHRCLKMKYILSVFCLNIYPSQSMWKWWI